MAESPRAYGEIYHPIKVLAGTGLHDVAENPLAFGYAFTTALRVKRGSAWCDRKEVKD